MRSHEFCFGFRQLARMLVPSVLALGLLIVLLHLAAAMNLLPAPAISADPDQTVLLHQSRASRTRDPAVVLLSGDSTCLVGVDARELSQRLPGEPPARNLSLIIGFGLNVYGKLIADFSAANPHQVRAVVLLVSAAKLRNPGPPGGAMDDWNTLITPRRDWLGVSLVRRRLLGHLLDSPLQGGGAEFFGFSSQLDSYMTAHGGSVIDFGRYVLREPASSASAPQAECVLSPQIAEESSAFRGAVPAEAKLFIGLTPEPEGSVGPTGFKDRAQMLADWDRLIHADCVLTQLPATLPASWFSRTAHLNREGQRQFTAILGHELSPLLAQ
jgi:hypothetical protein